MKKITLFIFIRRYTLLLSILHKTFLYILLHHMPLLTNVPSESKTLAVICVPVADLFGQPLSSLYPDLPASERYTIMPLCPGQKNGSYACPRLHQLLYNDIVEVIQTKNDEVCIRTNHAFYIIPPSTTPQSTYWTSLHNIKLLSDIEKIDSVYIPQPINYNLYSSTHNESVTLTMPHYDRTTGYSFSAGTRFVKSPKQTTVRSKKINVYVPHYKTGKKHLLSLPDNKLICSSTLTTPEKKIDSYVRILQNWANQEQGFIPYVWGGTSFISIEKGNFQEITRTTDTNEYSWYAYDKNITTPHSGLDCSGAILRATQICGIPYFYKNTTTINHYLKPLQPHDTLMNGDLIIIKGHVMVVSDIKKNLLIEARGYSHGYGKLQEIPLNKVFLDINTYQNLCDTFFAKKTLHRKDIKGTIRDSFNDWKIMRIMSLFESKEDA